MALAAVSSLSGSLQLATTVALPTLRGPVQLAGALAALEALAPGRVVAGVGPGSSAVDHALAGRPFDGRWASFDKAVLLLRALLGGEPLPGARAGALETLLDGQQPASASATGPIPVWVASWGSPAGLRRVARLGDGWLASAFHTTPERFSVARAALDDELERLGRVPGSTPSALATMWTHVTDSRAQAAKVLGELSAMVGRSVDELRDRVCVGSATRCAELLAGYAEAGCARVYLWPLGQEVDQLRRVVREVVPVLGGALTSPGPSRPGAG